MQKKERNEEPPGGDDEGKGGHHQESHEGRMPGLRHKDVQDYGEEIVSLYPKDLLTQSRFACPNFVLQDSARRIRFWVILLSKTG
jgi:hypothetical protein